VLEKVLLKQKMMRRVLLALVPIFLFAGYLYGLRLLILAAVVFPAAFICEYIFEKRKNKKVSEAVFVTSSLFLLSLPPDVPWWMALIGIVFAVVIGKEVFGGFGRNPFNPAVSGRLFIYITFPIFLTSGWIAPGNFGIDAVSAATPLALLHNGKSVDVISLLTGLRPGAFGESQIFLIIAAGVFLAVTRTASWVIMLSMLGSAALLTFFLDFFHAPGAPQTLPMLLSGSLLFVAVFIATDPVSAPKNRLSQLFFGIIVGTSSVLIRTFSLFIEGTSFGVLVGNTFALLLDELTEKKK
jgi:Na+-transporting NADH:ubiquinone oxidoreductase subunit B